MALSELEAKAYETDMQSRKVLLDLLAHKKEIWKKLQKEDISVLEEEQLMSLKAEITSQIQQFRFSGTFGETTGT